ncbi:MAG: hypothetical protein ABJK39_12735 [Hyphomicrobiales bacterium]
MMGEVLQKSWLDGALIDAHSRDDNEALIALYEQAGLASEKLGDEAGACFYFTHAYVFALEQGAPQAEQIKARLVGYGRDR